MATKNFGYDEFKFPDEIESEDKTKAEGEPEFEIDIEDDTPEEDRGRTPSDPDKVKQLEIEVDDLDKYSKDAKDKLIRMKRVWNDERRAKEQADRERQAALEAAQQLMAENNRIKKMLAEGEKDYKDTKKKAAKAQLREAERAYKAAYDAGDSDKLLEAQSALIEAKQELDSIKKFKLPPLQEDKFDVQTSQQQYQQPTVPQPDARVMRWQEDNPWFGRDEEMTAAALGLHEKMKRNGVVIGSDDYYATLDKTMRRRFAENFGDQEVEVTKSKGDTPKTKSATVVAPATRSTAPKRVRLTNSQIAIAKKLGITPESYVREVLKLEA